MATKYAIGIDLGGTHIKTVAVNESGEILKKVLRETKDTSDRQTDTPNWAQEARDVLINLQNEIGEPATWYGLCAPGLAAEDKHSIASMPGRMFGIEGFVWSSFFQTESPVLVLNDGQAALLGEVWLGAAVGARDAILLTLGTGVGGGIYADGKLLRGRLGRAGHMGHVSLDSDDPTDDAGMPGSLEWSIGDCTLGRRSNGKFTSTKTLVEAASSGDAEAARIWDRSVFKLGCLVASMINAIDPEIVVIGGGIAHAGPALFEPLQKHLDQLEWRPNGVAARVSPATLGGWAGAIGSAFYAIRGGN